MLLMDWVYGIQCWYMVLMSDVHINQHSVPEIVIVNIKQAAFTSHDILWNPFWARSTQEPGLIKN